MNKTFEELRAFIESQSDDLPIKMGQYTTGQNNDNCGCILVQYARTLKMGAYATCGLNKIHIKKNKKSEDIEVVEFELKVKHFINDCIIHAVKTFSDAKRILKNFAY